MKRVARPENELIVAIPLVVQVPIVVVEPQFVVIAFHIENPRVAVAVANINYHLCHHPLNTLGVEFYSIS
jgi:hypothetical protein